MIHHLLGLLVVISIVMGTGMPIDSQSRVDGGITTLTTAATVNASPSPFPLGNGCGGVTPPGAPPADNPCCVGGFVYLDGVPQEGAEVQIQAPNGSQRTVITQLYDDDTAYYKVSLSEQPLNITAGQTITITARYSSHESTVVYVVQPGGQHVDVVLPTGQGNDSGDYVYKNMSWGQSGLGTFDYPQSVAVDESGRIYVMDTGNARVQVFNSARTAIREWGKIGNLRREFAHANGLAIDGSGNIYVADRDNHRIQKFSSTGTWIASWGGFGTANGQLKGPVDVAVDKNGAIYVADTLNDRIQKWSDSGVEVWPPDGSRRHDCSADQFWEPFGITVASDGTIYVADSKHNRIKFLKPGSNAWQSWGATDCKTGDGPGQFKFPHGIVVDEHDNLYVADEQNHRVQKRQSSDHTWQVWGGPGSGNREFNWPTDVALNPDGTILYVVDSNNERIQQLSANSGAWQYNLGSSGSDEGQFSRPSGIARDQDNNLYVADQDNNRIQIGADSDNDGKMDSWTHLGEPGSDFGNFKAPSDVAVDRFMNVYVVDRGNRRVQKRAPDEPWVAWGSNGSIGAFKAFGDPRDVAVDSAGNVYVTDTGNDRIQQFSNAGVPLASWPVTEPRGLAVDAADNLYYMEQSSTEVSIFKRGSGGTSLVVEGSLGATGVFSNPLGLAVDGAGDVYVADTNNNRILQFSGTGSSTGTLVANVGHRGSGPGELIQPQDLIVDQNGIWVSDTVNNRLQRLEPPSFTKPIATITSPADDISLGPDQTLVVHGLGQVSVTGRTISAYRWTINDRVTLGTDATLNIAATQLPTGTHDLTLQVWDSADQESDAASIKVAVGVPLQPEWTMLLYLAGDYQDNNSLHNTFRHMLDRLDDNAKVPIAVYLDGPSDGDTQHWLIQPGVNDEPQQSVPEKAMDDWQTLAEFVRWGQTELPARHYYLAIADHGQGAQGIAWDYTSDQRDNGVADYSAYLTPQELRQALNASGVAPIDVLHLDACSMDLLEVAYELRDRADMVIASQYLGWSFFAYDTYQQAIAAEPEPRDLAGSIVDLYAELAEADQYPYTIAALDMAQLLPTLSALDDLALELKGLLDNGKNTRANLEDFRDASQIFESGTDGNPYHITDGDMYVDLADWAKQVLAGVADPVVQKRATTLIGELTQQEPFISAERHSEEPKPLPATYGGGLVDLTHSTGLSIFYPQESSSSLYTSYINNRLFSFTEAEPRAWPEFLEASLGQASGAAPAPPPLALLDPENPAQPTPTTSPTAQPSPMPTADPALSPTPQIRPSPTPQPGPALVRRSFLPLINR